jgi:hypothetical protein
LPVTVKVVMVKIQEPADSFCLLDEYLKFSSLLQQKMIATRAMPKGFSIQLFSRFGPAQRLKANGLLHMEEYKWRPIDERNRFGPTEPKSTGPSRSSSKPPATAELPQKSKPYFSRGPPMAAGGHLRPGSYLGDVSALSFLTSSPLPLLLAGTLLPRPTATVSCPPRCVCGYSNRPVIAIIRGLCLVAAGTGSELLVYDVAAARLVASFQVFDGVRVHGIEPWGGGVACSNYSLAVFGERRVKLFSLVVGVDADDGRVGGARLELDQRLPGFDHWVLDARFLEVPRWVPV